MTGYQIGDSGVIEFPKCKGPELRKRLDGLPMGEGYLTSIEIRGALMVYRWSKKVGKEVTK